MKSKILLLFFGIIFANTLSLFADIFDNRYYNYYKRCHGADSFKSSENRFGRPFYNGELDEFIEDWYYGISTTDIPSDLYVTNINEFSGYNKYYLSGLISTNGVDLSLAIPDFFMSGKRFVTFDDGNPDETYFKKQYFKFRIDDFDESAYYTQFIGNLKLNFGVEGHLHPTEQWYTAGGRSWFSEMGGMLPQPNDATIPNDIDVFGIKLPPGGYCLETKNINDIFSPFDVQVYDAAAYNQFGNLIASTNAFNVKNLDGNIDNHRQRVYFSVSGVSTQQFFFRITSTNPDFNDKYSIRVFKPKPVILVHGIMSVPVTEQDVLDRKVFCEDFDLLLEDLGYKVKFLCYDAGSTEDDAIKNQVADLKNLIETCYSNNGNQKVTLIAHSWGNIMCDLCHELYRLTDNLFDTKVEQYIAVAGPHSGSPIANIYYDVNFKLWPWGYIDAGAFRGCADAYKDAPEMGSSYMRYTSQDPFNNIIGLNGKWGETSSNYYRDVMRIDIFSLELLNRAPLTTLDTMMEGFTDGFIPDFSACSTKFINNSNNRKLVFSDLNKGMSHSLIDDTSDKLNAEFAITKNNAGSHGLFIAITNLLAGGVLTNTSGSYVKNVSTAVGAICREVNFTGAKAKRFRKVYAIINGENIELCTQDDDTKETKRRFEEAVDPKKGGKPESPFKILVASNGVHNIYSKRFHTDIDYSFAFEPEFTNKFPYIDVVENEFDISVSFWDTTSTGQFNVIGGEVVIDDDPLILNTN